MREIHKKIQAVFGEYDDLLIMVKAEKLRSLGNVSRSYGLAETILQFTVKEKERKDRRKKRWDEN